MADYVHVNGQLVPYNTAARGGIAPGDAGLLHGAGLFETMRARRGKVFRARQHLERLTRSAQALAIPFSLDEAHLQEICADVLDANSLDQDDARLRLTITRGDPHAATEQDPMPPLTLVLSATALVPYPAQLYEQGMQVVISDYKQNPENPLTGHKTTSYFDRLLALRQAQQISGALGRGAGEALWFTAATHWLAEGCMSNVFIVDKEGVLCTPPLTIPGKINQRLCLPGIARQVVLENAATAGLQAKETLLTIHDVLAGREMFLTNIIMGIMPVTRIEKHTVGEGAPGSLTRQLSDAFRMAVEQTE